MEMKLYFVELWCTESQEAKSILVTATSKEEAEQAGMKLENLPEAHATEIDQLNGYKVTLEKI